ncbi:MAG: ATP-binding protein [Rubrobacteraceae bacterium]|nr:ATP-binding protein [Rubrobacteraceae bacterium]
MLGDGTNIDDWREGAVEGALRAEAFYGGGFDALLCEIRRNHPECAVLVVDVDVLQALRFLKGKAGGFRSLISGSTERREDGERYPRPYVGWWAVEWKGRTVEVALPPRRYYSDDLICISGGRALLEGFVEALSSFSERPLGRCLRYTEGWESAPELDAEIGRVTWEDVVLPPETLEGIRDSVEGFFAGRDAFASLSFAWRRGILLVGPPGTGKTMVCKAVAAGMPDLPLLYVRDLRERREKEAIESIFERARALAPCLLVFEDIDGFVNQHNRSVFLNEVDGFRSNEGLLIIASSNHPGRIDEALLKRPSRFDRVFHIGLPAPAERREYCRRLLSRTSLAGRLSPSLDCEALAGQVAGKTDGFTPAYLKEVFVSAALCRAQAGAAILDEEFADAALSQVDELRAHLRRVKDPDSLAEMRSGEAVPGFR